MIWILAVRGASTKLRASPFTESPIEGVHSVIYRPGVEPVPQDGANAAGPNGTFARGLHRLAGVLFTLDGASAEALLSIAAAIDLLIRYRASGEVRLRTLADVVFLGDAMVTFPSGGGSAIPELIGVPFRVQIAEGETLNDHVSDEVET